jgi:hypothetical protein
MKKEIISQLSAPFPFEEVEVKIQVTNSDKKSGMVVFYLNRQAIQNRLDEVLGHLNWKNQYIAWQEKAQLCGIAIFNEERNEWVGKFDGAECSDIEPIKGGLSDSFKRAAGMWGIGRYLSKIDGIWVEIEPRGKSHIVKKNQMPTLKATYEAAVKRIICGSDVGSAGNSAQPNQSTQQPSAPPAQQNQNAATPPPAPKNTKPSASQAPANEQPKNNVIPLHHYKIHSIKPAGGGSQLLELCNSEGLITPAYVKSDDQGIAVGVHLRNVKLNEKSGQYGKYNLIAGYELAAA